MKIGIIGTGYVGLTTGACLAELGNEVVCMDIDVEKINHLIKGKPTIYEPGLKELIQRNMQTGRLHFSHNIKDTIEFADIIICCVNTKVDAKNYFDIFNVIKVCEDVGKYMNTDKLFILKSTVPVGTTENCKQIIENELKRRGVDFKIDIIMNPEFLSQGSAIKDTMNPDRVVIGIENKKNHNLIDLIKKLFAPIIKANIPILFTDFRSAELIKYTANAFLATKISFINDIAIYSERVGANIKDIAKGIRLDKRIGEYFLEAGIGYGGSCLPKDIKTLINMGKYHDHEFSILLAVDSVNTRQTNVVLDKLIQSLGDLKGKKIGIWGVTFKPHTDDLRNAPAITIIKNLIKKGAKISLYDPIVNKDTLKKFLIGDLYLASDSYEAITNAHALLILTEWNEFLSPDFHKLKNLMGGNIVIDGRNIYDPEQVRSAGLHYIGIGIN
jgi:UDPglucose 6-dehydrogenase